MLRVGKLTDYATGIMSTMAEDPAAVHSAVGLAERARLELPTVSKVLKMLGHAGLVESFRGTNGGYRLTRAPARITVAEIVAAMEGPLGMTECVAHQGQCGHEPHCGVRGNWQRISRVIEQALNSITLAELGPTQPRKRIPVRVLSASA
jgi:FeS assembly SUF system regulator